ncbi:MAG: nucleotidyl transferase AbiEii/AbiGii toxin family protein [Sphingobacteriaceae bacterium]|nr:nucleotidyl transferase AbiEii/AbiGii toxin family protein [Sphingobacteriaceae bacterium]
MDRIASFNKPQLRELFNETAIKKQVTPAIAEKDFWVTWVLSKIFADGYLSKILMFKGGTSLSKVFNIIERFSEDIDLVLDWNTVTQDNPLLARSNSQQNKFNQSLNDSAHEFMQDQILPRLNTLLQPICHCELDHTTKLVIYVNYPAVFNDQYLRPQILLEIGPLAAWLPFGEYPITSFAADAFPQLFTHTICEVKAIVAERTFWEKATILHHEANRPVESKLPLRYSRHYYDLAMLTSSSIKNNALDDISLLRDVVEFKQKFYPCNWAKYEECLTGNLKLIPPEYRLKVLQDDYKQMRAMIFGSYPDFSEILDKLQPLENEINLL